ncbi:MAG: ATP-dependent endonuclease [Balneolaceae bacterium]
MKIESVRVENFRSFKDETIVLDDYSCCVGANGSGKSTVLHALNVFFRQFKDSQTDLSKLTKEDFHHKDTSKEIKITVTFGSLSQQAEEDLADYVRQGKLIVSALAMYDEKSETAEVKQYGNRLGFEDFAEYFEKEKAGVKAGELKDLFLKLKKQYPELRSETTKANMASALRDYEADHPDECTLLPSEDQFYGISRGVNRLAPHIQWVFIPGAKDATEESEESRNSALGQLLERTVRSKVNFTDKISDIQTQAREEYQQLLGAEQSILDEISQSLQSRLTSWAHPDISAQVRWKQDPDKSVRIEEPWAYIRIGERGFEGDLARFGHGLQRSYLLALLQELALIDDDDAPKLIMGIEEPELYQHPPQARHLAEVLQNLSNRETQVLLCTHNPLFIPGDNFDKVRIVRESGYPSYTTVTHLSYDDLAQELEKVGEKLHKETGMVAKLYPSLNPIINEMFFCKILILVEGPEDLAFITSILMLTGKFDKFRSYGCHIVPVNGKSNLIKPLAMSKLLNIPTYVIFDADTDKDGIADENKRNSEVARHKKDNRAILNLQGYESENEWPENHIIKDNLTCWKTNIGSEVENEIGADWQNFKQEAEKLYDNAGGLNKNPLVIAKILELAWSDEKKSEVLSKLADRIIQFAEKSSPRLNGNQPK